MRPLGAKIDNPKVQEIGVNSAVLDDSGLVGIETIRTPSEIKRGTGNQKKAHARPETQLASGSPLRDECVSST